MKSKGVMHPLLSPKMVVIVTGESSFRRFCLPSAFLIVIIVSFLYLSLVVLTTEPHHPSIDRIYFVSDSRNETLPDRKVVLFWTAWFGDAKWSSFFKLNRGSVVELEDGKKCMFTTDRKAIRNADALIFHGRDYKPIEEPMYRHPDQVWALFSIEPPPLTFYESNMSSIVEKESTFNWTISYSTMADVPFPYGRVVPRSLSNLEVRELSLRIARFARQFFKRERDMIWIASHCPTPSSRELIVEAFEQLGLRVDRFGRCAADKTFVDIDFTNHTFFSKYRYYLAFENSLCEDYLSEKFFKGLKLSSDFGIIPVTYHGQIPYYSLGVPQGAFVDVQQFLPYNVTGLAHYLKEVLPHNVEQLTKMYSWQFGGRVDAPLFNMKWRNFCSTLWRSDVKKEKKTIESVRQRLGNCYQPHDMWRNDFY